MTHPRESGIPSGPYPVKPMFAQSEPSLNSPQAQSFYTESLRELKKLGLPFLIAGTYAVCAYTGVSRPTKDLDIFCKAGDYPRILSHFKSLGYSIEVEDERWLAKVYNGNQFFDVIFASWNGTMPVSESWFSNAREAEILGVTANIIGPTELIWSKAFIQSRQRFDGADVAHIILKQHDQIDWPRLLNYMEQYWEVLLTHLVNFRWIYPTERNHVPDWLMGELIERLNNQMDMPLPQMKVCRGRMFSRSDYEIDVQKWGFADVGGEGDWRDDV